MTDVLWIFQDSADVDADLKMILEHRSEVAEIAKASEKIVGIFCKSEAFEKLAHDLKTLVCKAKARVLFSPVKLIWPNVGGWTKEQVEFYSILLCVQCSNRPLLTVPAFIAQIQMSEHCTESRASLITLYHTAQFNSHQSISIHTLPCAMTCCTAFQRLEAPKKHCVGMKADLRHANHVQEVRESVTQTVAVMVVADVFLNPKYTGKAKEVMPQTLQYIGTKLGMTKHDLAALSPKLVSQIDEALGGSETSSRRKTRTSQKSTDGGADAPTVDPPDHAPETGPDAEEMGAKKRKKTVAPAPKASSQRSRKRKDVD